VGRGTGAPAAADLLIVLALELVLFVIVVREIGSRDNEKDLIALAAGLVLPIVAVGVVSEARLPLSLLPTLRASFS
jgi:hypothetical protein